MKIAQIAPVEEIVPPRKYGGTELVVYNLTEELVKRGHDVTLFASGDSKTSAKLVPLVPQAIRLVTKEVGQEKTRESWKYIAQIAILEKISQYDFDIIHQHVGWRVTPLEHLLKAPVVMTCHGPLTFEYAKLVYQMYKNNNYISISNTQRKGDPSLNYIATVYNGIDIKLFDFEEKPQDYYAFLGRMSPEKGPRQAILAAKKAGVKLKMAAKIDATDNEYFNNQVKPLIDGKQISYIGEIGPSQKNRFLGQAKALLAPIQWEEPFGLYFIEAMATGTPVISIKRGSAHEIIVNNKTGFLVDKKNDVDSISQKIRSMEKMSNEEYRQMRKNSRLHMETKFSVEKMVDEYERVYEKVMRERHKRK